VSAIYYMFEVEYFMFNLSLDLRCSYAVQTTYMGGCEFAFATSYPFSHTKYFYVNEFSFHTTFCIKGYRKY
jgi:hypothetical protein